MAKGHKTLRIDEDILDYAKQNNINLHDWINENFKKYEMQPEVLEAELKELELKLADLNKRLVAAKELRKKMKLNQIGEEELKFLRDMSDILETKPNKLNRIVDWYNEKFIKEISQKDFKKLIEDLK